MEKKYKHYKEMTELKFDNTITILVNQINELKEKHMRLLEQHDDIIKLNHQLAIYKSKCKKYRFFLKKYTSNPDSVYSTTDEPWRKEWKNEP